VGAIVAASADAPSGPGAPEGDSVGVGALATEVEADDDAEPATFDTGTAAAGMLAVRASLVDAADATDALDAPELSIAPEDGDAACTGAATVPVRDEAASAASGPCACATESGNSSAGDRSASTDACQARYNANPQNAVATVATRRNRLRARLAASWPIPAGSERGRGFVIGSPIGSACQVLCPH
jgi:hypothetical protein